MFSGQALIQNNEIQNMKKNNSISFWGTLTSDPVVPKQEDLLAEEIYMLIV